MYRWLAARFSRFRARGGIRSGRWPIRGMFTLLPAIQEQGHDWAHNEVARREPDHDGSQQLQRYCLPVTNALRCRFAMIR